jgi:hypothetical protein
MSAVNHKTAKSSLPSARARESQAVLISDAGSNDRADVGIAGRRVPQSANSTPLTSPPGSTRRVGGACKMRRSATRAMFSV